MPRSERRRPRRLPLAVAACALLASGLRAQGTTLSNAQLRVQFGPAGLSAVTEIADGRRVGVRQDGFAIRVDGTAIVSDSLGAPTVTRSGSGVRYRYTTGRVRIDVNYELRPGWRFVSKQLAVTVDAERFHVDSVAVLRESLEEVPSGSFNPTSARPSLGTLDYGTALRFADGHSLLLVAQNPFLQVTREGREVGVRYAPDMDWSARDGAFLSDRAFIAPVRRAGRVLPAHLIPEWKSAGDPAPGLDTEEIARFTSMVRAMLPYTPSSPLNVFVGWCANDYQIDVATAAGRAEYKHLIDQAAAVGARYVLYAPSNSELARRENSVDDWSWEHVLWLGLGQRIRRNEWDPRTSAIPSSVSEMLAYARTRQVGLLAYVYPVMPFAQNDAWLVPARNPKKQAANLGNRALQDWLIEELVAFHARTGIAGYSFDHTFLNLAGTSRYAQWYGWRRVMEELRRRVPGIVIDGRQAYHQYGPWSYLAGSYPHPTFNDEQPESFLPYPDLHFDRVSADRERYTAYRYRNYEFTPSELVPGFITHQTSRSDSTSDMPATTTPDRGVVLTSYRARDWDYLGWRYSLLSSIAVAGWNNVLNMLPARDSAERVSFSKADQAFLRRWLAWTDTHKELLRHTRTILGPPRLGAVDGTAAIVGNAGFVFLFNPDARRLPTRVPLDASIGVTARGPFVLREVYPVEGARLRGPSRGTWMAGDTVALELDGGSALVLELAPVTASGAAPTLYGAPGTATLREGVLRVDGVRGEIGRSAELLVALPPTRTVTRAVVNGVAVPIAARGDGTVTLPVRFTGEPFGRLESLVRVDSSFSGGTLRGTFTIPRRVFDQLAARRQAWPIPWTEEDLRTTWLAPERLLLHAPMLSPDDSVTLRLTIDDALVPFERAYSAVRKVSSTFVGLYADLSTLRPDRTYRFELVVPPTAAGRFRGLYFENVEPEYTTRIEPGRR